MPTTNPFKTHQIRLASPFVHKVHKRRAPRTARTRFDFPKDKGLQTYSAIYVPTTQDVDKKITPSQEKTRVNTVRNYMTKKFGGTTTVKGIGAYTTQKGKKVVTEKVYIVENFSDPKDWRAKDQDVQKFVQKKAKAWGQESVGFEFEAPHYQRRITFVSPQTTLHQKLIVKKAPRKHRRHRSVSGSNVLFPAMRF